MAVSFWLFLMKIEFMGVSLRLPAFVLHCARAPTWAVGLGEQLASMLFALRSSMMMAFGRVSFFVSTQYLFFFVPFFGCDSVD